MLCDDLEVWDSPDYGRAHFKAVVFIIILFHQGRDVTAGNAYLVTALFRANWVGGSVSFRVLQSL